QGRSEVRSRASARHQGPTRTHIGNLVNSQVQALVLPDQVKQLPIEQWHSLHGAILSLLIGSRQYISRRAGLAPPLQRQVGFAGRMLDAGAQARSGNQSGGNKV